METMTDVRQQVDRIDSEIIALMAQRFACMDAAARIKQDRNVVRDEVRKAAVLENVKTWRGVISSLERPPRKDKAEK